MTDIEKESIEQLKSWREYIIKHKESVNKANDIEFYLRTALNLIQKQDAEINKLKNVINKMAGKILLMRGVEEYRDKSASREDIKEYFMKNNEVE